MTTALEAYVTGVVFTGLSQFGLPNHLHPYTVTSDRGEVTGIIELHTPQGQVRMTIAITEHTDVMALLPDRPTGQLRLSPDPRSVE